jgi:OOP family OmpA-OmpF porin
MRVTTTILVLAAGVLVSSNVHRGSESRGTPAEYQPPLAAPRLAISSAPSRLSIAGTSDSVDHEAALLSLAGELFADADLDADFRPGVIRAANWQVATNRLLYAVASMKSAEAELTAGGADIRGVTADADVTASRIDSLRRSLPPSMRLATDIIVVRSRASLDDLCRAAFAGLVLGPVSFARSSAELRPASFATLDRITEFALDCPSATIAITGHTDASGDESWNRQLSLARAQAVADRITSSGIDARRLVVAGAGSGEPIADNSTAYGRELNRRIEFELR